MFLKVVMAVRYPECELPRIKVSFLRYKLEWRSLNPNISQPEGGGKKGVRIKRHKAKCNLIRGGEKCLGVGDVENQPL